MFSFVIWLRNRPSIKYVRNWGNERGSSKMCTGAFRGRGLKNRSKDTYILSGWPETNVVEYFLCTDSAKYNRASPPARKMSLISYIIITIILSYVIIRIWSPSSIFESPQKNKHSILLKESLTQVFV